MLARRLTLLTVTALAIGLAAGCSRKQPPATDDRGRVEPPPATDTSGADADAARRAEEEARLARERAFGSIQEMIFFDFDRSDLREDARATLQRKAEALRQFPDIRIRIEGHADERGTVEYNLALGERRADAARAYLIDLGIDPDRMTTISYGEERALVEGQNEAAWSQNRRDEFVILGG
ncbi:MAG TPA: peptidoglycan-associated lipoprotein Pal [Gemmatimonadota bacterium]|nr:peptidoglycan-associated lipoprotein Pal [Gemmatimonadota bacterium]